MLSFLRLLQGLAVGGELISAWVFTIESCDPKRICFWTSLTSDTACLGTFSGMFVVAIIRAALSKEELSNWGWRLPFYFSLGFALFGIILRRGLGDSEAFAHAKEGAELSANPTCDVIKANWKPITLVTGIVSLWWVRGTILKFLHAPYVLSPALPFPGAQATIRVSCGWSYSRLLCWTTQRVTILHR